MTLSQRDRRIIWHPFTQEKTASEVIPIKSAKGSYLYDEQDKAYLDLISSWWVNLHGHAHPDIANSIYEQANQLEHVIFSGFTHAPAVELCEELQKKLPDPLSRFFFSDNGSTAVEVALKMAYQYWVNKEKKERTLFLSFEGGYHGDTFGAMSVGCTSGFHSVFSDLFFKVLTLPYPATWEDDKHVALKEEKALIALDEMLKNHGKQVAAIILEPLVQGASGMRMCRAHFVKAVVERVRAFGVLVIFDEIMTGFGRTGTHFAHSQTGVTPDFLCLSKGITGGFLPLAMTITHHEIYGAFLSDDWKAAFAHGHSYTANPLACAAARTSLKLLMRKECQQAITTIHEAHRQGLAFLKSRCKQIEKFRTIGTISAFDVKNGSSVNAQIKAKCLQAGLLIRPLGATIYLLPPYSTTSEDLSAAYQKIATIIEAVV